MTARPKVEVHAAVAHRELFMRDLHLMEMDVLAEDLARPCLEARFLEGEGLPSSTAVGCFRTRTRTGRASARSMCIRFASVAWSSGAKPRSPAPRSTSISSRAIWSPHESRSRPRPPRSPRPSNRGAGGLMKKSGVLCSCAALASFAAVRSWCGLYPTNGIGCTLSTAAFSHTFMTK